MGINFSTACGGNFEKFILNRKGALPRAVRESRDYDSAVRARFLTAQWAVAPIEVADSNPPVDAKNTEVLHGLSFFLLSLHAPPASFDIYILF